MATSLQDAIERYLASRAALGLDSGFREVPEYEFSLPEREPAQGFGIFTRGVARGFNQLGEMGGGLMSFTGDVLQIPALEKRGAEIAKTYRREIEWEKPRISRIEDIENFGDGVEWLLGIAGEQVPILGVSLATGVGGAAVAGKTVGAPLFGAISQNTARGAVAKLIEEKGLQAAASIVGDKRKLGAYIGSFVSESGMQTGSIASDMIESGAEDLGAAGVGGLATGAVGALADVSLLGKAVPKYFGKEAKKGIASFAIGTTGQGLIGGGTEGFQAVGEQIAVGTVDPQKGLFGEGSFSNIINSLAAGTAIGLLTGGLASSPRLLNPSKDPKVNETAEDVSIRAKAKAEKKAEADKLIDEAKGFKESEGEGVFEDDTSPERINSFRALREIFKRDVAREPTEAEDQLLLDAIVLNEELVKINEEIDDLLERPGSQEVLKVRNAQAKRISEQIKTIGARLSGIEPESVSPTREKDENKRRGYAQEKGAENRFEREYAALKKKWAKPESKHRKIYKQIESEIDNGIRGIRKVIGGLKVKLVSAATIENDQPATEGLAKTKATNFATDYDEEGNIYIAVPSPERVLEAFIDQDTGELNEAGLREYLEQVSIKFDEEAIHAAIFEHFRRQWNKSGKKTDFVKFANRKLQGLTTALNRSLTDESLRAMAKSYGVEGMSGKALTNEVLRALVQRIRNGVITEDIRLAAAQKNNEGNTLAAEILDALLEAVRIIRDALVNLIDAPTAAIKEVIDGANKILDEWDYEYRIPPEMVEKVAANQRKAPQAVREEVAAPTIQPEQENAPTGQETQARAAAEEEPIVDDNGTVAKASEPNLRTAFSSQPVGEQALSHFYSQLSRVLDRKIRGSSATPDQVRAIIDPAKGSGIKPEEIKWSGIEQAIDRIASENGGKVPKDVLMSYLRNEGLVRFEEVTFGGTDEQQQLIQKFREAIQQGMDETDPDLLDPEEYPDWAITAENLIDNGIEALKALDKESPYKNNIRTAIDLVRTNSSIERRFGDEFAWRDARRIANDLLYELETYMPSKYGRFQLPGGENYREVVLAMPVEMEPDPRWSVKKMPDGKWATISPQGYVLDELSNSEAEAKAKIPIRERPSDYESFHFQSVSNYVAHMRLNERTDADGKEGLFIEELQSDRHQEGRSKGYQEPIEEWLAYYETNGTEIPIAYGKTEKEAIDAVGPSWKNLVTVKTRKIVTGIKGFISDAPHRKDWPLALFKRALRDAVASGKDWIGWTVGQVHTNRWGTEQIKWRKDGDAFLVEAKQQSGGVVDGIDLEGEANARGLNATNSKKVKTQSELRDAILPILTEGQDPDKLADKIWKRMQLEPEGVSQPRKEGFEGFYDNILPKEIGKYVKQWGATVKKSEVPIVGGFRDQNVPIWRIDITPEMRKTVQNRGQATFASQTVGEKFKKAQSQFDLMMSEALEFAGDRLKSKGGPARSNIADYIGDYAEGIIRDVKTQKNTMKAVGKFIEENGFLESMRVAASGVSQDLKPEEMLFMQGFVADMTNRFIEDVKTNPAYDGLSVGARQKAIGEAIELHRAIAKRFKESAENMGRGINIIGALKKFFFDGRSAAESVENMIFAQLEKVEPGLNREVLAGLHDAMNEAFGEVIERTFSSDEMFKFIGFGMQKMLKDPIGLKNRLRESIKLAQSKKVARRAAAMASDIEVNPDTEEGMQRMFEQLVDQLVEMAPFDAKKKEESAKSILRSALKTMAEQYFSKEEKEGEVSVMPLKVLASLIVNDKARMQFIDLLESKVAERFEKGRNDPEFIANYKGAFKDMREGNFLERARRRAAASMLRALETNIASMIRNGWEGSKAEIMERLRKMNEVLSDRTIEVIYDEVEAELDRMAEMHLEKTWGFERGEDGKLIVTEKGKLRGGKELIKFLRGDPTKDGFTKSLTDITKLTYAAREAKIDAIAEALVEAGLPLEMTMGIQKMVGEQLKEAVEITQNENIINRIEDILKKLSKGKKAPNRKNVIDSIVEMANQGYLDVPIIYEAIRKQYKHVGLPKFDPKVAELLREVGDKMQTLPEGYQKAALQQLVANEIANMGGIKFADLATSYWYFSMLSGYSTWLVINPVSSAFNLLGQTSAHALLNPSKVPKMLAAIYNSVVSKDSAAKANFLYTMRTGLSPVQMGPKLAMMNEKWGQNYTGKGQIIEFAQLPVERITEKIARDGRWWAKLLYGLSRGTKAIPILKEFPFELSARTLSRFLMATDQFFRTTGTDAALAFYSEASIEPFYKEAQRELAAQGMTGLDLLLRAREVAMEKLAIENGGIWEIDRAETIGFETSFTQPPKGLVGALARFLARMGNIYPPVKVMFPFTNIVANVWNESLNYTPVGYMRWAWAKVKGGKTEWTIVDKDGKDIADNTILAKSLLGTIAFVILAALDKEYDEIEIVGFGPRDQMARVAFFEKGMKPYSIRFGDIVIGYEFLPVGLLFGIYGSISDVMRENRGKETKFEERFLAGAVSIFTTQMSQSFLSSFSSMIKAWYSPDPGENFGKWLAFQGSVAMPNIVKQIYNDWIDRDQYRSSDFFGQLMAGMAVTKKIGTQPALNYYGDHRTRREIPLIGRIASFGGGDKIISDIDALGLRLPGYSNMIGGIEMTDEQITEFRRLAGPQLKEAHAKLIPKLRQLVGQGKVQEAQDLLTDVSRDINKRARQKMLVDMMRNR